MTPKWCLALLAACCLARAASAQVLELAPVTVQLAPGERAAALTLTNRGTEPVQVQVRPFLWTMEQLLPTDDVAVSPPMAQLSPGQAQTIRMVLRRAPGSREGSYRLLIDQLPPPPRPGAVWIVVRMSVPVFAAPADSRPPDLLGRVLVGRRGATLAVENRGVVHTRVLGAALSLDRKAPLPVRTLASPYILAGGERSWPLAAAAHLPVGRVASLTLDTDAGPIVLAAPVAAAP